MARFRKTSRPLSRAARLTKEWLGFATVDPDGSQDAAVVNLAAGTVFARWIVSPADAYDLFDQPTILRILVQVTPAFRSIEDLEGGFFAAGIIVTRDLGPALGGPPSPYFASDDWVWSRQWNFVNASTLTQHEWSATQQDQYENVLTKRRVPSGYGIAYIAENRFTSAGDMLFSSTGRILLGH